jgi:hypothetical protein
MNKLVGQESRQTHAITGHQCLLTLRLKRQ